MMVDKTPYHGKCSDLHPRLEQWIIRNFDVLGVKRYLKGQGNVHHCSDETLFSWVVISDKGKRDIVMAGTHIGKEDTGILLIYYEHMHLG